MTAFPAYCPDCKTIFPFHGIEVSTPHQIQIGLENIATNCPVCGSEEAKVSDAVYSANSSAVSVLSAPESSRAIIEAFFAVVEQAATGKLSQTEAARKAADISPRYRTLLEQFATLGLPGLTLLLALLQVYLQYDANISSSRDSERLLRAINEQILVLKSDRYVARAQGEHTTPVQTEIKKKSSSAKPQSNRRAEVRKTKRLVLKQRRNNFGGARCR